MNRLFASLACLTLLAASATAQSEDGPRLSTRLDKDGVATVTAGPLSAPSGVLVLLGAFDGAMAPLGPGLPSILVNSAILAWTFDAGAEISVSGMWPHFPVLLQAVEVSFAPFGVQASLVHQVGDGPAPTGVLLAAAPN